jgi:hypothetical protein
VKTNPDESAPAQKEVVGQDTESRPPRLGSIDVGADQRAPSNDVAVPSREIRIQNVLVAHATVGPEVTSYRPVQTTSSKMAKVEPSTPTHEAYAAQAASNELPPNGNVGTGEDQVVPSNETTSA